MLTTDDLNKIQFLIVAGSNQVVSRIDKLEDRVQQVEDKVDLIPTKEEYFDSMSKLMGEVKKGREEQEVIDEGLSQHNDRLEKLEEKVVIASPY